MEAEICRSRKRGAVRLMPSQARIERAGQLPAQHEERCNCQEMDGDVDDTVAGRNVAHRRSQGMGKGERQLGERSNMASGIGPPCFDRAGSRVRCDHRKIVELERAGQCDCIGGTRKGQNGAEPVVHRSGQRRHLNLHWRSL